MNKYLKSMYRGVLRKLPVKPALYLIYFRGYHRLLNLKNPKHFGEKIQWLKLYGGLEELSPYVDKYEVRKFVADTVGEKYLNELYGVYDSEEDVDFDSLPDQFVLKCTNGSGAVLVCRDKSQLDIEAAKKTMKAWLADEFYKMKKEPQYKNVKNRIIAEKYLEDGSGALRDYKFYCYDGEPVNFGVFSDRFTDETVDMYDMSGCKLEVQTAGVRNSDLTLPLPENFDEIVSVTRKLAEKFSFVRVDYYLVENRIIFGELTFTDGAGSDPFTPEAFDLEMGDKIPMEKVLR